MPFAIMRNSHEALRASIRVQEQRLETGDTAGFGEEWQHFQRALKVHMAMEDDSMFGLLDEVGAGVISSPKLPAEHIEDQRLAANVDAALDRGETNALRVVHVEHDHLHHLAHEEEVMMPLTMKTAPTPEGRARVVHDRLLGPSNKLPNFDWYIGWVVGMLSQHGSTGQPANVATRVFAWGLQHACSPSQWNRLRVVSKYSRGWSELEVTA